MSIDGQLMEFREQTKHEYIQFLEVIPESHSTKDNQTKNLESMKVSSQTKSLLISGRFEHVPKSGERGIRTPG